MKNLVFEKRKTAEKQLLRQKQDERLTFSATHSVTEAESWYGYRAGGLDEDNIRENRSRFGSNKVTKEKKETKETKAEKKDEKKEKKSKEKKEDSSSDKKEKKQRKGWLDDYIGDGKDSKKKK